MFHFFNTVTNIHGDSLPGYYGQVTDGSGNVIPIYSDDAGTAIATVSGIANMAKTDTDGMLSFYVPQGTYTLTIFSTDAATRYKTIANVSMGASTVTVSSGAAASSRAAMAAIANPAPNQAATLTESGREGMFVFDSSNLSAEVAADTAQGIYVAPSSDTTGASGAWIRKYTGPANVKWFGAAGDGSTDDTTALTNALAAVDHLEIPAATFIASSISIGSNKRVRTAGFDTIIKQKSGTDANTRLIKIIGSNVVLGDLSVEGQLNQAGDTTGEQNHGVFVALESTSTASISNVSIGDVRGTNIRGDLVYIGSDPTAYTAGYRISDIAVGRVVGTNIYRNVVSVVGAANVSIESVNGTQVGKAAFDAEPDVGAGPITGLRVGYIKGRCAMFVGPTASDCVSAHVDVIEVDPSFTTTSSPDYGALDYRSGLTYRNVKSLRVERLYANGHYGQAILPVAGALTRQELSFGNVEIPTGCTTETTNACYIFGDAATFMTIDVLVATTTAAVANQAIFTQCTNIVVKTAQISLAPNSYYMRACAECSTGNLNVSRASGNGGRVDISGTRNRYFGGTQFCDYFFSFAASCLAMNVNVTAATSFDGGPTSGSPNYYITSILGGTFSTLYNGIAGPLIADTGVLQAAGMPAFSGEVSKPAGSLATTVLGAATATSALLTTSGGVGYRTGAGGAVTQITSKTTSVTLNKVCGQFTTINSALAAGALATFQVNNSNIASTDTINLNLQGGQATAGTYRYWIEKVASGSFQVTIENRSAGSLSEALVFNFAVLKAVAA